MHGRKPVGLAQCQDSNYGHVSDEVQYLIKLKENS